MNDRTASLQEGAASRSFFAVKRDGMFLFSG
jgi:hypothetical protein